MGGTQGDTHTPAYICTYRFLAGSRRSAATAIPWSGACVKVWVYVFEHRSITGFISIDTRSLLAYECTSSSDAGKSASSPEEKHTCVFHQVRHAVKGVNLWVEAPCDFVRWGGPAHTQGHACSPHDGTYSEANFAHGHCGRRPLPSIAGGCSCWLRLLLHQLPIDRVMVLAGPGWRVPVCVYNSDQGEG